MSEYHMSSPASTGTNGASRPAIPIISLRPFREIDTSQERLRVAQDLVRACREVGFVYISDHGIPQETLDQAFAISKKFFSLPREQKMKAPHPPGWAIHRGYSWPGLEKVSAAVSEKDDPETVNKLREVQDYKESYEIGSEDNVDQPNIWPPDGTLPEWRPFMTSFYWTCFEAAKTILQALAIGIGLEQDRLLRYHSGHFNQLRLLHYPPVPAQAVEEGKLARMPAHTDWSTMTMLFQDDCGGLQVEDAARPGQFIDVAPIAGTLVMNVGDLLMRWSNDYLTSTSHRVTLPPQQDRYTGDERLTRARYAIPYFVSTDPDAIIECLLFDEKHPPKYEPITERDYAAMRARMQY